MKPLRILIADDHELIRDGLKRLLTSRRGWQVCGQASNGREAVDKADKLNPDVVVLDFSMPELNGLEAACQIRKRMPQTEVLILTMYEDGQLIQKALAAGARACVLKSDANELLIQAVATLAQHKTFLTPKVSRIVTERLMQLASKARSRAPATQELPPREREVLQCVAEGKSSKQIASHLGLNVKTIEAHRAHLMQRLRLHSVPDLVLYAVRNKIVKP